MAKAPFNKKYTINATGILSIDGDIVSIENVETGELIPLARLVEDFSDCMIKLSLNYDEDYITQSIEIE